MGALQRRGLPQERKHPSWVLHDVKPYEGDGEVIATITYGGMPRWQGRAVLDNVRYHYRLTIESASE